MARENTVFLHGQIQSVPKIYGDKEGNLIKAMYFIKTLRRPINIGKGMASKLYLDCPIILTRNQALIKISSTLRVGDMVDIRGVLTTKEVTKTSICPECGGRNSAKGNTVFVTPIYICKREDGLSPEDGLKLLKERSEISNLSMVIGTLCREPQYYMDDKKSSYAQYQLAVNRSYRIPEDAPDIKTDYPWVKTFGNQALNDSKALHVDSTVYINGALQTREIERSTQCESCMAEYTWKDTATEIVPYHIEYLANCEIPEPVNKDETGGKANGEENEAVGTVGSA